MDYDDYEEFLPENLAERAMILENIMILAATNGGFDENRYAELRRDFLAREELKSLVPSFIRTHRKLSTFRPYMQDQSPHWADRRRIIGEAFTPLQDFLEGKNVAPGDSVTSSTLETFDSDGVHTVWEKALTRRANDPEGAITSSRTLLETVIKRILDERACNYSDSDDLPKIYSNVSKSLSLAPDQHSDEAIKLILRGGVTVVNGIGTLRNKLSDSHGRGGKLPIRPTARHAALAVNMAGAIAMFLVETHNEKPIEPLRSQ